MSRFDRSGLLTIIYHHNKMLVFGKTGGMRGSHAKRHLGHLDGKLLYTGVSKVKIKKQYDINASFRKRMPGMSARGTKFFQRVVDGIQSGRIEAL
jgi:hypothetical protein